MQMNYYIQVRLGALATFKKPMGHRSVMYIYVITHAYVISI